MTATSPSPTTSRAPSPDIGLAQNATYKWNWAWRTPLVYDTWHDLVLHVHFSSDPTLGFVEVWQDGVQQSLSNGQTRLYFSTLNPNDAGAAALYLDQYRSVFGNNAAISTYADEARIGTTLSSVLAP